MKIDPTQPLYENSSSKVLPMTASAKLIDEACRFIKLTNPKSMWNWGSDDYTDAMRALEYLTEGVLCSALHELKCLASSRLVEFGDFYRLAQSAFSIQREQEPKIEIASDPSDWRECELQMRMLQQEREIEAPKMGGRAVAKYWKDHIKNDLKKAIANMTRLPYDKRKKVT